MKGWRWRGKNDIGEKKDEETEDLSESLRSLVRDICSFDNKRRKLEEEREICLPNTRAANAIAHA